MKPSCIETAEACHRDFGDATPEEQGSEETLQSEFQKLNAENADTKTQKQRSTPTYRRNTPETQKMHVIDRDLFSVFCGYFLSVPDVFFGKVRLPRSFANRDACSF